MHISTEKLSIIHGGVQDVEWPEPKELPKIELKKLNVVDEEATDLLTLSALNLSESVQFPLSTAYLHGLGVIGCALNKNFKIGYYNQEIPVPIYMITSQPPSTGKSSIHNFFSIPYMLAVKDLNQRNEPVRNKLKDKLKKISKEIEKATHDQERDELCKEFSKIKEEIKEVDTFNAVMTNTTPEAIESVAFSQKGVFNVMSDESGAVTSSLGVMYADSNRMSNNDMVLKGWDGGYHSSYRVNRDTVEGFVYGGYAVLAQQETVEAIFAMGERGNGISERFLLCMEQNWLGKRDFSKGVRIDNELQKRYAKLMYNIVNSKDMIIRHSDDSITFIRRKCRENEEHLADLKKYSHPMLRGFVGKMEKHILKISAILHAVENFEKGITGAEVCLETTIKAFGIFSELMDLYVYAAGETGRAGDWAQLEVVRTALQRMASKGQLSVKISTLLDNIKKTSSWKRQEKIISHFKINLMPKLADLHWCDYDPERGKNYIRINRKI